MRQGDVVRADFGDPRGSGPALHRPAVVIQRVHLNRSRINTIVVVAITSNSARGGIGGNVRLSRGEGGLPRDSIVVVSQIATLDRTDVHEKLGRLSPLRYQEVWEGILRTVGPDLDDEDYGAGTD